MEGGLAGDGDAADDEADGDAAVQEVGPERADVVEVPGAAAPQRHAQHQ